MTSASPSRGGAGRPRPWALVGLVALAAFLVALEWLFLREAEAGRAQLDETRRALEQYGTTTLARALSDEWELATVRVAEVEANPLRDSRGLLLVRDGEVVLPRVPARASAGVEALVRALESGQVSVPVDDDVPWAARVRLLEALRAALSRRDVKGVEAVVRQSLEHRLRFVLPPREDLAATVALLELLSRQQRPAPELMQRVLRDGLSLGGTASEGLQAQVLRAWPRLGADDVRFLCAAVTQLSRASAVPAEDFERECGHEGVAPPLPPEPGLWVRGARDGAVVRTAGDDAVGLTVDVAAVHGGLVRDMRERGLLAATDSLAPRGEGKPAWTPLSSLALSLTSPRQAAAHEALTSRLVLKSLLALVTLLLGVGVVWATQQAQARRARYLALQSDFVATVSHELRTPLASMRVMAETLERRLAGHAAAKDYPARLVQTVDGLGFLVENILSFNRLEKGRWQPKKGPVALSSLRAALEEDAANAQPVVVTQAFEGFDGVTLQADGELLRVVVLNLLRNAWKYNAREPVTLRWVVSRDGDMVVLRVTDNGVGVPREAWESVFEAFHRLRDGRGRGGGGSGLGLALCRRIAVLHGGGLHITDSSPEGTTFELRLPAR